MEKSIGWLHQNVPIYFKLNLYLKIETWFLYLQSMGKFTMNSYSIFFTFIEWACDFLKDPVGCRGKPFIRDSLTGYLADTWLPSVAELTEDTPTSEKKYIYSITGIALEIKDYNFSNLRKKILEKSAIIAILERKKKYNNLTWSYGWSPRLTNPQLQRQKELIIQSETYLYII